MKDQAVLLRQTLAGYPRVRAGAQGPPTLVVGSGKGGVGKSLVTVLLGAALAARHRRVLLVDGSQNLGSLHIMLGVRPVARLDDLFTGTGAPADLITPVAQGLWLLPAECGSESLYALPPLDRARLHHRLASVFDEFDVVLVDAGEGLEGVVRVANVRATDALVVTTPEPAALSGAYALLKMLSLQVPGLATEVLVNRAHTEPEAAAAHRKLAIASDRFLNRELALAGSVLENESLRALAAAPRRLTDGAYDGPGVSVLRRIAEQWTLRRSESCEPFSESQALVG